MTDRDRLPMYEGKDQYLREKPCCSHCLETPATKLLRCSRCHVAWHCNASCHKKALSEASRFVQKNFPLQDTCFRGGSQTSPRSGGKYLWNRNRKFLGFTTNSKLHGSHFCFGELVFYYCLPKWSERSVGKTLFHILEHLRSGAIDIDHMGARIRTPYFCCI